MNVKRMFDDIALLVKDYVKTREKLYISERYGVPEEVAREIAVRMREIATEAYKIGYARGEQDSKNG